MHSMSLARTSTFHIFPMASSETSKKSQHVNIFAYLVRLLCFPYLCLSMLSILHIRVFCISLLGILSFCIRQIDCLLLLFSFVCLSFIVIFRGISSYFHMLENVFAPPDAFSGQIEGVPYLARERPLGVACS